MKILEREEFINSSIKLETQGYASTGPQALFDTLHRGSNSSTPEYSAVLCGQVLATGSELTRAQAAWETEGNATDLMDLPGSYAAIVRQAGTVSLITDVAGQFPLYYARQGNSVHYGTDAARLAALTGNRPNRYALGEMLLAGQSLGLQDTEYASVKRVPAASVVRISPRSIETSMYDWLVPDEDVRYQDAVAALHDALHTAVSRRVENSPHLGSDFSGGFDSTSLAFLAAKYLPAGQRLDVYHHGHSSAITGDARYAAEYADLDPRFQLHQVRMPSDILPYDVALMQNSLLDTALPSPLLRSAGTILAMFSRLSGLGITDHMAGHAGDALLAAHPFYLADLIRKGALLNARRIVPDLLTQAQSVRIEPLRLFNLLRQMAAFSLEDSERAVIQLLNGQAGRKPLWHAFDTQTIDLLHPRLRSELAEILAERFARSHNRPDRGMADHAAIQEFQASSSVTELREIAGHFGVALHSPFLDRAVAKAALGLQAHRRTRAGQFKPLLRDALQHDVPAAVFNRRSKGNADDEDYLGLAAHGSTLRKLLGETSLLAELGVIDVTATRQALTRAELGQQPMTRLPYALAAEMWLRRTQGYDQIADPGVLPPEPGKVPALHVQSMDILDTWESRRLHVPDNIRMVQDRAAITSFNLITGETYLMHHKARMITEVFHKEGTLAAAYTAFRAAYPTIDPNILIADIDNIVNDLTEHGVLEEGEYQPFAITPAVQSHDDSLAEIQMLRDNPERSGVKLQDYFRMGRFLRIAGKLIEDHTLYDIVGSLRDCKAGLPFSTSERVTGLLKAGHIINRYVGKAACLEFTIATVLAEARRGRRVDLAIGTGGFPRQFHTWPVVDGEPVQTAYDEVIEGRLTPFDIW